MVWGQQTSPVMCENFSVEVLIVFRKLYQKSIFLRKYLGHIKFQIQFLRNFAFTAGFITYFDKKATFFVFPPRISRQI